MACQSDIFHGNDAYVLHLERALEQVRTAQAIARAHRGAVVQLGSEPPWHAEARLSAARRQCKGCQGQGVVQAAE